VACRTLANEICSAPSFFVQPEQAPVVWFVLQRAVDAFRERHGRFPSPASSNARSCHDDDDRHLLLSEARTYLTERGVDESVWNSLINLKHAEEM
jgi:hypothetical protein